MVPRIGALALDIVFVCAHRTTTIKTSVANELVDRITITFRDTYN